MYGVKWRETGHNGIHGWVHVRTDGRSVDDAMAMKPKFVVHAVNLHFLFSGFSVDFWP